MRILRRRLCRVVDEELAVLFELGMEREAQEAFFVLLVVVLHAIADIEKRLHLARRSGSFGKTWIVPYSRADEDAVRAVAGAGEEQRPRIARLALVEAADPIGPFKLGNAGTILHVERPLVDFGEQQRLAKVLRVQCRNKLHFATSWGVPRGWPPIVAAAACRNAIDGRGRGDRMPNSPV